MASGDQLNIRNVDPALWREIRAEAVRHGLSAGALLNIILGEWLADHTCATDQGPQEPIERRN